MVTFIEPLDGTPMYIVNNREYRVKYSGKQIGLLRGLGPRAGWLVSVTAAAEGQAPSLPGSLVRDRMGMKR